jgi:hypothetical protein
MPSAKAATRQMEFYGRNNPASPCALGLQLQSELNERVFAELTLTSALADIDRRIVERFTTETNESALAVANHGVFCKVCQSATTIFKETGPLGLCEAEQESLAVAA